MKRILCILIVLTGVLRLNVFASAADADKNYNFSNAQVGDIVTFGNYEQDNDISNGSEPIEWLVLARDKDRILVISRYGLDCKPYHTEWSTVSWQSCTLRSWLNEFFLRTAFTEEEQMLIPTVNRYTTGGNQKIWERVFLLESAEAIRFFPSDEKRKCEPTAYAIAQGCYTTSDLGNCWWWMNDNSYHDFAPLTNPTGTVDTYGGPVSTTFCAVRPVIWINLAGYPNPDDPIAITDARVGDIVTFGKYEQDNNISNGSEPIKWLVLSREESRILVISWYALDCQPYSTSSDATWENCTLRTWLNGVFLSKAFTEEEQAKIQTVTVSADRNPAYKTDPGNNTIDQLFLLSIMEENKYCYLYEAMACVPTAYALAQGCYTNEQSLCCWWLRSPGSNSSEAAFIVNDYYVLSSGNDVRSNNKAVRPAMWITLGA